ncbi:hypothetical protein [Streptomyces sp. SPB074]|uniref:hypothetical protein n=1 Tax=Streptomyces sp. (strain SPB074) TaxID=465543 RepID=UPI00017FEB31|nr:hypothetical protein [Streptomyces sp. SPB074]EDY44177.1 hypothetical protein SSBG_02291 [Streptomyces sp. SPB074]
MAGARMAAFAGRHGWYFRGGVPGPPWWALGAFLALGGLVDVLRGDAWAVLLILFGGYVPLARLHRVPGGEGRGRGTAAAGPSPQRRR